MSTRYSPTEFSKLGTPLQRESGVFEVGGRRYTLRTDSGFPSPQSYYEEIGSSSSAPGAAAAPATPTSALDSTLSRYTTDLEKTANQTVDPEVIRQERIRNAQSRIDAINKYYNELVARRVREERTEGDKLNQEVRAYNVRAGLGGSDFATSNAAGQERLNQKAIKAVEDELEAKRNFELSGLYDKIDGDVQEEVRARRAEALGARESLITFLTKRQEDRRASVARLGALGTTIEKLKENPQYLTKLLEETGYSEGELQYELNKARNDATRIKYETKITDDGKVLMYGIDPTTNKLVTTTVDTTVPEGMKAVMKDGTLYWEDANGVLTPAPIGEKKQLQLLDIQSKKLEIEGKMLDNRKKRMEIEWDGSDDPPEEQVSDTVKFYAQLLSEGKITVANVPLKIRNAVVRYTEGNVNKPLSDTAITQINQTDSAISSLNDLRSVVSDNEKYLGPIRGLQRLNPYSKAKQAQADINRVRQRVGKALEGGVLRKEDEEKYKKILATLSDVPETAIYKIDQLKNDLQRDIENYKKLQSESGRYVPPAQQNAADPLNIR